MSKHARIENGTALEVFVVPDDSTIEDCFHPEIAALFSPCPDQVTAGSTVDTKGKWTIASASTPPEADTPPQEQLALLTPMTVYMAFKPEERIAIKGSTDPMVQEFWAMYQLSVQLDKPTDPNLKSVIDALNYLAQPKTATPAGVGILASFDRVEEIRRGVPQ
ncbi:MAG: hypothetical protein A2Y38_19875 [Spirochaetes bacterium GWB1_59_5]|nr:MAG: hypothetical protein A2Y38_19875 [Spirochaetes bacterium GWB1_59_5]